MEHLVNLGNDEFVDTVFGRLFAHFFFFFLHVVLLLLLVDCRSHRNLGVADGMFCIVRARPASTLRVFVAKCCWQTGQRGEKVWHRVAASCCWKAWKMLFVVRENLKEGDV